MGTHSNYRTQRPHPAVLQRQAELDRLRAAVESEDVAQPAPPANQLQPPANQRQNTNSFDPNAIQYYNDGADIPFSSRYVAFYENRQLVPAVDNIEETRCKIYYSDSGRYFSHTFKLNNVSTTYRKLLEKLSRLLNQDSIRARSQVKASSLGSINYIPRCFSFYQKLHQ